MVVPSSLLLQFACPEISHLTPQRLCFLLTRFLPWSILSSLCFTRSPRSRRGVPHLGQMDVGGTRRRWPFPKRNRTDSTDYTHASPGRCRDPPQLERSDQAERGGSSQPVSRSSQGRYERGETGLTTLRTGQPFIASRVAF